MDNKLKIINNILTDEELNLILNDSFIVKNLENISKKKLIFKKNIPDTIAKKLKSKLNLNFSSNNEIPFTIIKGDTDIHIDQTYNLNPFKKTYLYYLTDSNGSLKIENEEYPIKKNTCYIFDYGLNHGTINTNETTRLMIGPMNESLLSVGVPTGPIIDSITPGSGVSGTLVNIEGNYFTYLSSVTFNNINAKFNIINDTNIDVIVPFGLEAGVCTVYVTDQNGYNSNTENFTINILPNKQVPPNNSFVVQNLQKNNTISDIFTDLSSSNGTGYNEEQYNILDLEKNKTINSFYINNQNDGNNVNNIFSIPPGFSIIDIEENNTLSNAVFY